MGRKNGRAIWNSHILSQVLFAQISSERWVSETNESHDLACSRDFSMLAFGRCFNCKVEGITLYFAVETSLQDFPNIGEIQVRCNPGSVRHLRRACSCRGQREVGEHGIDWKCALHWRKPFKEETKFSFFFFFFFFFLRNFFFFYWEKLRIFIG